MATKKPRVAVTLNENTHEVIARLAEIQGRSRGAVIADLLNEVAPVMARTVALLEAAAAAPGQVKDGLRKTFEGLHADLLRSTGDSIVQMDMLLAAMEGAEEGANPHVVTRGSGGGSSGPVGTPKRARKPRQKGV